MNKNYYKTLNIDENSDIDDIKKQYRKLSLKYHPDRGGDAEKFKEITEAYEVLGDKDKRNEYDMLRNNPFFNNNMGNPINMNDILGSMFNNDMGGGGGGIDMHNILNMMGGINAMPNIKIFTNRGNHNFNRHFNIKPTPILKCIDISLENSYSGGKIPLDIERYIINNNAKTTEKETIYIEIKQGIDNNEIILLENMGNINNGIKGDLKIKINILTHKSYRRLGLDLLIDKELTLKESLLGFNFNLKHLNGKKYSINNDNNPNVIEPNQKLTINDMGMVRDGIIGRLIINFIIKFPKKLTDKQIKILKDTL